MKRLFGAALVLAVLLTSSCAPPPVAAPTPEPSSPAPTAPAADLANPAAVFCKKQGFRSEIRTDAAGNQSGVCIFPDGSECDEWAYFRDECSPSGEPSSPLPTVLPLRTPAAISPETTPGEPALGEPAPAVPAARDAETYVSPNLGISFSYLPYQNGQTIKVLEQGDKVYVYPTTMEPTAGQWVQVFKKQPSESLVDAIERVIMPGHPAADCQVVPVGNPIGGGAPLANAEYAGIVVRREAGEDEAAVLPRWRTCPQPYTVVGGIGYFQADRLHPDKFLFFSIGQYAILAGKDVPWQQTVAFE